MKYISWLIILLSVQRLTQSRVYTNNEFVSKINSSKRIHYYIYLHGSYETSIRNYPIIYLLQSFTGKHYDWFEKGQIKMIADDLLNKGIVDETIIVMPNTGDSWNAYYHDESLKNRKMFFDELIHFIESTYRISKSREQRAIAGLSMARMGL